MYVAVQRRGGVGVDWAEDPVAITLASPARAPGERFGYSNSGSHLVSAILEQATGTSVLDYARSRLFDPPGIDSSPASSRWAHPENFTAYDEADFAWAADLTGLHLGFAALKLRPVDLARIGSLSTSPAGRGRASRSSHRLGRGSHVDPGRGGPLRARLSATGTSGGPVRRPPGSRATRPGATAVR